MKKKVALTGDRPTGQLHLGHYIGSLLNRVKIQDIHDQYVMIADIQALTDNFDRSKQLVTNIIEIVKDYIAVGIVPNKTTIFLQSRIAEIAELTVLFLNLVTVARLQRNPTVKTEIKQKFASNNIPAGFLCYPISQAADITAFKAEFVPVGEDQLPMIEQTNEIIRKFNNIYQTNIMKETQALLSDTPRLLGIDGREKAGKSLGNAIFLADENEVIKNKVFSMFTDPDHLKVSDPGKVEGNVVFAYLDAFHSDKEQLQELKDHYRKGGLGDSTIKSILFETLQKLITPIREKRKLLKDADIREIIFSGTKKAQNTAAKTMEDVRISMGLL